ncbi:MAG: hypothetical protein E5X43_20060, partial [Mesorhizobium sp.]
FWTAAQMLEHLGESASAIRLMGAVETVTSEGVLTPDVGGTATTQEVTDARLPENPRFERVTGFQ